MAGAFNRKISELNPKIKNATIKAIILTKSMPNFFEREQEIRGVITFTVRDSRTTVCNCKFWGTKEKVEEYNKTFGIGDVITIVNPLVATAANEVFMPFSTSHIMLIVNEGAGYLLANGDFNNTDESYALQELLHSSHKPLSSVLRLADIRHSQAAQMNSVLQQQLVDLLVIVVAIKPVREIHATELKKCLEVIVIDRSLTDGMILSIWHVDWIERAEKNWIAMKTVLHLIDVKVVNSVYHKSCILRFGAQTIIYENPLGREAATLRSFVTNLKSYNFESFILGNYGDNLPKPEDIRTQMTVKQIYSRLEGHLRDDSDEFTAVLYALISKFDIDGYGNVLGRKCKNCQRILSRNSNACESSHCQLALSFDYHSDAFVYFFNMNIHLGDHTGTLVEGRLYGAVAERLFNMTAVDFRELSARNDERIAKLKSFFLLNYFEIKLLIKKATAVRRQSTIIIVDAKPLKNVEEIADHIMVF